MDLPLLLSTVLHRSELAAFLLALPAAAQIAGPPVPVPSGQGVATKQGFGARLIVVDDTPECRFSSSLQAAIDAASDGDIVLVRPGTYTGGISIDGKGVSVFGDPQGVAGSVRVTGSMSIKNLQVGQSVLFRDLKLELTSALSGESLNKGNVWIERCSVTPILTLSSISSDGATGIFNSELSRGMTVSNNASVFAYLSRFQGIIGIDGDVHCTSYCYAYDTYWPGCWGTAATSGTSGILLTNTSHGYLFGCTSQGGKGGAGSDDGGCCLHFSLPCSTSCKPAGSGVSVSVASELEYMDLAASGGATGCPPGAPLAGDGMKTELLGEVGDYSITGALLSGGSAQLVFRGPPGWNVFLTYSGEYAPLYLPEFKGYSVVDPNSPTIFIGQIPLSGELQASIPFSLPATELAKVLYSQAKLYDPNLGTPYLASASAMLVFREPCP